MKAFFTKSKIFIGIFLLISFFGLMGCISPGASSNKNLLEISEDGAIKETIVDDSDGIVTGEELESQIDKEISEFSLSGESVSLEKCKVTDEKVDVVMKYSSANAYSSFNNITCFRGTYSEASQGGFDLNINLKTPGGSELSMEEIKSSKEKYIILIVQEPLTIKLPTEVTGVSENVAITDKTTVQVSGNADTSLPRELQGKNIELSYIVYRK